jgi:hypothetical protein
MKNIITFLCILFSSFSFAQLNNQAQQSVHSDNTENLFTRGMENLRSDTIDVLNYSVYLDFTEAGSGTIKGNCEVKFEALMDVTSINLDLLQLTVDSIVYDGNQISYSYNDTLIVAQFGTTLTTGTIDSLTVYYQGSPQQDPSGLGGYYSVNGYYFNLGVGIEADPHNFGRVWHPCFDNFVERATYDFEILTNNNFNAYCNGTRTSVISAGTDSLLTHWDMSTEIPTYLAGVAVSDYTHVDTTYYSALQGVDIPVWLIANEADTADMKNSFVNLFGALEAYETYYGPFVWEKVGYVLVPFNFGAMEHATNIAYPLITANGTTQFEWIMAHELSHNWWGNWVTCETAEEMWINEGMAVYSEHLFYEHVYDSETYMEEVRDNHYDVLHRHHVDDSGFYALNAVPLDYTYGEHSYRKGADVIHTLRSYMGDTDFFAGLQQIQSNHGGDNISSTAFRDELNSLSGVDVTDFFNDWIFSPGYSNFSIKNYSVTPNGGNFDVEVLVDQKLKGASSYHNNVPFTLTFMDASWTTHEEAISVSGDEETFTLTIPIDPVFVALNMDEKINDATTAVNEKITATGVSVMSYANTTLNVTALTDSAFVRIEHHWVEPNYNGGPANVVVSKDRYWAIHGIDLQNIEGTLKFSFNGQNNASGDFDNSILTDWGSETFTEDSIVLLWRPNEQSAWEIHQNIYVGPGSPFDKKGDITALEFAPGHYTFGYKTMSSGTEELISTEKTYSIYPNPAEDIVLIDLIHWETGAYTMNLYEVSGRFIESKTLQGATINELDIQDLSPGMYTILLTSPEGDRIGSKRLVIQ